MAMRRGIRLLVLAVVPILLLAETLAAQSGPEPPLADRLNELLLNLPDLTTNESVKPAEAERHRKEPPRPQRGPGFLAPLSTTTPTGRAGVAGWTTSGQSGAPRATSDPEQPGWFGFGFGAEWGGPRSEAP